MLVFDYNVDGVDDLLLQFADNTLAIMQGASICILSTKCSHIFILSGADRNRSDVKIIRDPFNNLQEGKVDQMFLHTYADLCTLDKNVSTAMFSVALSLALPLYLLIQYSFNCNNDVRAHTYLQEKSRSDLLPEVLLGIKEADEERSIDVYQLQKGYHSKEESPQFLWNRATHVC